MKSTDNCAKVGAKGRPTRSNRPAGEPDVLMRQAYEQICALESFPAPSEHALSLARLIGKTETPKETVLTALAAEHALTTRIRDVAHVSLAGTPFQVSSVTEAVSRMGSNAVRGLILCLSLAFERRNTPCARFSDETFWLGSVGRGAAARHIAHLTGDVPPWDAFALGIMSRVGCLAFAAVYRVAYGAVLESVHQDDFDRLRRIERSRFETDHRALSADMVEDWGFPREFVDAVRSQDASASDGRASSSSVERLARILQLATTSAAVLVRPETDLHTLNRMVNVAGALGIRPHSFHAAFDDIRDEWSALAAAFGLPRRNEVPRLAGLYSRAYAVEHRRVRPGALPAADGRGQKSRLGAASAW